METDAVSRLFERQNGVATTAQLLALGVTEPWIGRRVRTGLWQRPFRALLVHHSGPLTWRTRFQAALLYAGPGALLSHEAAAYLHGFRPAPPTVVPVVVPARRSVTPAAGIRVHRSRLVQVTSASVRVPLSGAVPPGLRAFARTSFADTALDLAALARTPDEIVACLSEAARARTPQWELRAALDDRPSIPGRAVVRDLLAAVSEGVESPLEYRYHVIERRHGLPHARLQVRECLEGQWIRADRIYEGLGVRVELDGRLAHPGGRTDQDTWRDNAVLLEHAELTLRYRWSHVIGRPCGTVAQVVTALRSRGWSAPTRSCGPDCAASGS